MLFVVGDVVSKRFLMLTLSFAAFTAGAVAQDIVIEPTNGRAQSKIKVSKPATVESTAPAQAKAETKAEAPARVAPPRAMAKAPAKKAALKQVSVAKAKPPVEARPIPEPEAKVEAPAPQPVAKQVPARPSWATTDSRDPRTVQTEIANALARDPKLAKSAIKVSVDDTGVTLEGQASGADERLQAARLAQSYAWNRKVLDRVEVVRSVSVQK